MASAANSGKTNREIVTDWYTRYAEEIAGYENPLANLNIQLTQAQQDGDTARADGLQGQIKIVLKYAQGKESVIKGLKRISKPGLRVYAKSEELPKVLGGLGIAIISTSKGLMTDKEARKQMIGGEVLAYIW